MNNDGAIEDMDPFMPNTTFNIWLNRLMARRQTIRAGNTALYGSAEPGRQISAIDYNGGNRPPL